MKVQDVKVTNFKRLRYIEMKPAGELVVVGGDNGQGKTSLLDALAAALAGRKSPAPMPVRAGQPTGEIVVRTDDGLIIRQEYGASGTYRLRVTNADGAVYPKGETFLGRFSTRLQFDPLAFTRMRPAEQVATLKDIAGLDFGTLDRERQKLFDERTAVNREVKAAQVDLERAGTFDPDLPADEVDIGDLADAINDAAAARSVLLAAEHAVTRAEDDLGRLRDDADRQRATIARMEAALAAARDALSGIEARIHDAHIDLAQARGKAAQTEANMPDIDGVRLRFAEADVTNKRIRANNAVRALAERYDDAVERAGRLTGLLAGIDARKAAMLDAARFPVPGLSFDAAGEGLTLNGIPFEQASGAETLRVSLAVGMALQPELKVMLIRDGSLLDDASMTILEEIVTAAGVQVFIERVGTRGASIVIEDGVEAAADTPKTQAAVDVDAGAFDFTDPE